MCSAHNNSPRKRIFLRFCGFCIIFFSERSWSYRSSDIQNTQKETVMHSYFFDYNLRSCALSFLYNFIIIPNDSWCCLSYLHFLLISLSVSVFIWWMKEKIWHHHDGTHTHEYIMACSIALQSFNFFSLSQMRLLRMKWEFQSHGGEIVINLLINFSEFCLDKFKDLSIY